MTIQQMLHTLEGDRDIRRVTVFLNPRKTMKLTRQFKANKSPAGNTFILSIGRPNCREREIVKRRKCIGQSLTGRAHIDFWPKGKK